MILVDQTQHAQNLEVVDAHGRFGVQRAYVHKFKGVPVPAPAAVRPRLRDEAVIEVEG